MKIRILIILIINLSLATSLNILGLFPFRGKSHYGFFRPILLYLAEAGHNVTVYSVFRENSPPPTFHDVTINFGSEDLTHKPVQLNSTWMTIRPYLGSITDIIHVIDRGDLACTNIYDSKEIKELLASNRQYDVILTEMFFNDCIFGIAWKLKAPVIGASSSVLPTWYYKSTGNPLNPSFIPGIWHTASEKMNFIERFTNFYQTHIFNFIYKYYVNWKVDTFLRKQFGNTIPPVDDLVKNVSLIFTNSHYIINGAKPISPSVVELGGIHIRDTQPLRHDINEFLDNAKDGVIYVSWGSLLQSDTLPPKIRNNLLNVFESLKQKVIWKWESNLENKSKNILIDKWLPQKEILCHPNVRVFFTHGGLLGSTESIYCGVPLICTPFYGDQFTNCASFVNRGIGTKLSYDNITEISIREAINFALNEMTQNRAQQISYAFKNRLNSPSGTAKWWVEYVSTTNGELFNKPYSVYVPLFTYYSLDVIFVSFIGIFLWNLALYLLYKRFFVKKSLAKKIKTN